MQSILFFIACQHAQHAWVKASNPAITANSLNEQYALISTDATYTPPLVKSTSFEGDSQISEFQIFRILDHLRHTASGLDGIPAWFLRLAAPVLVCFSLLQWPRLHMLLQLGGDSLTPRIGIALGPLSAEQLGMATAQTLHQLSPRYVTKPIWQFW